MYNKTKTLVDRREMLKVKIKSLAEEARIIRKEEERTFGDLRDELHVHRVTVVRRACRHAILAYAIVRGVDLLKVEPIRYTEPNWADVEKMVRKYGSSELRKWAYTAPEAIAEAA
jgi:hypothetical protein